MVLTDKIALVTGGAGLLGSAMVADIRKRGGTAVFADISCETDKETGSLHLDITNPDSISRGISTLLPNTAGLTA